MAGHMLISAVEENEAGAGVWRKQLLEMGSGVTGMLLPIHPLSHPLLPQDLSHAHCSPDIWFLLFLLTTRFLQPLLELLSRLCLTSDKST